LGYSNNRSKVEHVWIINKDSDLVRHWGFNISESIKGLLKYKLYEVDAEPYNTAYQNLNIYELPEFRNLKQGA
jgi:hypothetical protein